MKQVKTADRPRHIEVANEMQRHLYALLKSFNACDHECLSRYGVTAAQGYALLSFPKGSDTSMNELSRAMGLANSTLTRMVETLIARGLATRQQDDEDRRVVRVALTAKGRELRRSLEEARLELQRRIMKGIEEGERHGVVRALEILNRAMHKMLKACCAD